MQFVAYLCLSLGFASLMEAKISSIHREGRFAMSLQSGRLEISHHSSGSLGFGRGGFEADAATGGAPIFVLELEGIDGTITRSLLVSTPFFYRDRLHFDIGSEYKTATLLIYGLDSKPLRHDLGFGGASDQAISFHGELTVDLPTESGKEKTKLPVILPQEVLSLVTATDQELRVPYLDPKTFEPIGFLTLSLIGRKMRMTHSVKQKLGFSPTGRNEVESILDKAIVLSISDGVNEFTIDWTNFYDRSTNTYDLGTAVDRLQIRSSYPLIAANAYGGRGYTLLNKKPRGLQRLNLRQDTLVLKSIEGRLSADSQFRLSYHHETSPVHGEFNFELREGGELRITHRVSQVMSFRSLNDQPLSNPGFVTNFQVLIGNEGFSMTIPEDGWLEGVVDVSLGDVRPKRLRVIPQHDSKHIVYETAIFTLDRRTCESRLRTRRGDK